MVYLIGKIVIPTIYKLWLRKVNGLENLPKQGAFIIAANHSSYYDALLLHCIVIPKIDKKIHALVNSSYWSNSISAWVLEWGECIPVYVKEEKNLKKNKNSFQRAINYLKNREIVQIFPEGTRSPNGKLKKAYTGVAKLVIKAKVPVLPMGIIGSNKVLQRGKMLPRFKRCEVKIGKVMHFNKYKKSNKKTLEEITRQIMKEIAGLIGQKYNY